MRRKILRDYKGTLFPGEGDREYAPKQIINFTMQAADSMVQSIAANRPRFLVTPQQVQRTAFAGKMERALNRYAALMGMEEILQEIARDAFSSIGIGKVYMADSLAVGYEQDYRSDPGKPFLQRVCLDHFAYDCTAASWPQASFIADRYRISYDQLMADVRFRKWRDRFRDICNAGHGTEEDQSYSTELESVSDYIWLADVYVAAERMVYTYCVDPHFNLLLEQPIAGQPWRGDECGPYYFLNLGPVPDECMPSSPGQNLKLLTELCNTIYRKLEDQARRMKIITIGHDSNTRDADVMRQLEDGEHATVSNPDAVKQFRFDGPDSQLFGFFINAQQQFSRAAGNLDNKLGLSTTAGTVGQESMISAQVSRMEGFMQQRYVAFVRQVSRGLARLLWEDGFTSITGTVDVEGTPFKVEETWEGATELNSRQGAFADYIVDIDPYSMAYQSPQDRLAAINQQMQLWMGAMPLLAQMGYQPDLEAYFEEVSRLGNLPEVKRIFKQAPPMAPQDGGGGASPNGGEYVHRGAGKAPEDPNAQAMAMMNASGGGE